MRRHKRRTNSVRKQERHARGRVLVYTCFCATLAVPILLTLRGTTLRRLPEGPHHHPSNINVDQDSSGIHGGGGEWSAWHGFDVNGPSMPRGEDDIHIVFSTDCSPYQNYQSIVLFNSAEEVGQAGPITRIASGCSREEADELQEFMDRQPERFRVHFTPDFSVDIVTGERYMFYNKPNGMAHFLRHANPPVREAVIALLDPDMILVGPLSPYVGQSDRMLWRDETSTQGPDWVREGWPVGQFYGLGGIWATWSDLEEITKELGPKSPARRVTPLEAQSSYPVGPPYMMHPRDWARVIDNWVALCPKVYAGHKSILSEMYGFCIAAAHVGLKHRVTRGLMVSDARADVVEAWDAVESLGSGACDPLVVNDQRGTLPPVLHYCQMYRIGTFMFGKRHTSLHDFFTCQADSLMLPPPGYLDTPMGKVRIHPQTRRDGPTEKVSRLLGIRHGYAVCSMLRAMNAAQAEFKERYCDPSEISGDVRRVTDLSPNQLAADAYGLPSYA